MKLRTIDVFEGMPLPLNEAGPQTFAWVGNKGGGKTYGTGVFVEQLLLRQVQVVIIDMVGNWWGLRLREDGKGASGFDIPVLGGLPGRGDVPLAPEAGALVADLVVETGRSFILDLSQFSKAQRKRFCTDFAERLWLRKKGEAELTQLHIVLEECQLIVPQRLEREEARMYGAWEEIIRLGRNYGVGVSMLTQRVQSVNKEVLELAEVVVAFRTGGTHAKKALRDWLVEKDAEEAASEILAALPKLKTGQPYVWSPSWLEVFRQVRVLKKTTFDASATPKAGVRRHVLRELAPLNLDALREAMSEVTERAEQTDPRALQRKVAQLTGEVETLRLQLAERPAAASEVQEVPVPVIPEQMVAELNALFARFGDLGRQMEELLRAYVAEVTGGLRAFSASMTTQLQEAVASLGRAPVLPAPVAPTRLHQARAHVESRPDLEDGALGKGQEAMLRALARAFHAGGLTKVQLGFLAGYAVDGGTFQKYFSHLNKGQYLVVQGERVVITQRGLAHVGGVPADAPRTRAQWRAMFREKLPKGPGLMLEVVERHNPNTIPEEKLQQESGYSEGGTFDKYVGQVRRLELVDRLPHAQGGGFQLNSTPFPA